MEKLAIRIENVTKEYRLGAIGGGTLRADLQSWWAKIRHKEDPNQKIGAKVHGRNEIFRALDNVSFDVKQGDFLGILGHNGAGKSTILKLICRVTAPTRGTIYLNGRITSMLEVGTGFHPELTGRENVFLNGAILGMRKAEISKKFDQIVEFSEVDQFIDTPVKRYSSGMKVKLAFSVASHLDSEIMIMDEVLAVGDVSFQNKCIERMKQVASDEGRTVLYVSHNMATIKKLCSRCVVLAHGTKIFEGDTNEAIAIYMKNNQLDSRIDFSVDDQKRKEKCTLRHRMYRIQLLDTGSNQFEYGSVFKFRLYWSSANAHDRVKLKMTIYTMDATYVGIAFAGCLRQKSGENEADFLFDTTSLIPGKYNVFFFLYDTDDIGNVVYYDQCNAMRFEVIHSDHSLEFKTWFGDWGNAVLDCVKPDK